RYIDPLSLHDALPIFVILRRVDPGVVEKRVRLVCHDYLATLGCRKRLYVEVIAPGRDTESRYSERVKPGVNPSRELWLKKVTTRSEEHTSELQSRENL